MPSPSSSASVSASRSAQRMVANLRNVDESLAQAVADELGLPLPEASVPARPKVTGLPESPALCILKNGPDSFAGRKLGIVVTDGTAAAALTALEKAFTDAGATVELSVQRRVTSSSPAARPARSPTTRSWAHPRCSSTRWRCCRPPTVPRSSLRASRPRTSLPTRSATTSSSAGRRGRRRLLDAAGVTPDDGLPRAHDRLGDRLPGAVCGVAPLGAARPGLTDAVDVPLRTYPKAVNGGYTAPRVCCPPPAGGYVDGSAQPIPWEGTMSDTVWSYRDTTWSQDSTSSATTSRRATGRSARSTRPATRPAASGSSWTPASGSSARSGSLPAGAVTGSTTRPRP